MRHTCVDEDLRALLTTTLSRKLTHSIGDIAARYIKVSLNKPINRCL